MRKNIIISAILFSLVISSPGLAAKSPSGTSGVAGDIPQSWLGRIQQDIAAREYHVSAATHKNPAVGYALQAPNRQQNLRTWFTSDGILVQRRIQGDKEWICKLRPEAVGVAGAMHKLAFAKPKAEGNRVSYQSSYLEQWFENRPEGLEQGFTIPKPLGKGELVLRLAIEGGLKPQLKNDTTISLLTPSGAAVLEYGSLMVVDAADRKLASRFSLSGSGSQLLIQVKTTDAVYPLTIDPLLISLSWQAESDQRGAIFGFSVSSASDVDNDGFDDVIVGAPYYDNGQQEEGAAFVYMGSQIALSIAPNWFRSGLCLFRLFGCYRR
ncbi:MAG: FG-GAP repeat protein [Deltaproteobacteria bacterium]|nr:FG-GAP repeat protein [Candidatus Tharpella aukensis]